MITTTTIDTAPILMPNSEHKNFTESRFEIPKGTEIKGEYKIINGLRRGKPFDYRVFITDKEQIIYSKYVKPMATTEVTLGADAQVQATKVEMIPAERTATIKNVIGGATGGIIGYAIAKKQGVSNTKTIIYASIGALAGYLIAKQFTKKTGIVVEQAK
jgi:hypothetical protein